MSIFRLGFFIKWIITIITATTVSFWASAQKHSLDGEWVGVITQEEGGYMPEYDFELYITVHKGKVTGRSYAYVDDIYAMMEFDGRLLSQQFLILEESHVVDHRKREGMEWCIKKMQLAVKKDKDGNLMLEGFWSGKSPSGPCIPGKIILRKGLNRA